MNERLLAESVRRAFVNNHRRILVRNVQDVDRFTAVLESVLGNLRVFRVDCTDNNSFGRSLSLFFAGDGYPATETAFEAGWRSHVTEISLYSEASGLEVVAGLHSIKEEVKEFILGEHRTVLSKPVVLKLFASFVWSLPTVIFFENYTGREGGPVSVFSGSSATSMPSIIVFRNDCGSLDGADEVIESGLMSLESVRSFLQEESPALSAEHVLNATGGDDGLVKLYSGLYRFSGIEKPHVFSALDEFLNTNRDLAVFAGSAALYGMQFVTEEALELSCVHNSEVFETGRQINLWSGHLVGCFSSESIREHILKSIPPEEKDGLLKSAAEIVLKIRGKNSRSHQAAGDLFVRAGLRQSASESYESAAETGRGEHLKAGLYRRAAFFSSEKSDHLLFLSALNLYRGELYPEALEVLKTIKNRNNRDLSVLISLCEDNSDVSQPGDFSETEYSGVPELAPAIVESRNYKRTGSYHRAERVLLSCVEHSPIRSLACLVELGEQLYKRGMVKASLNTMTFAMREAESLGSVWLKRRALFVSMKAWNRLGKQDRLLLNLGRLTELVLLSGNRRKLVSVYNLYANSLIHRRNLTEALDIYTTSLRSLASVPDSQTIRIIILNNMGVVQQMLNRAGESLRTLMRQVRISVSSGNLSQACIAYGNMARIFINLCKTDAAEDCLETMIELASLGNVAEAAEPVCSISSRLAFMRKDTETALSLMDQSIQLSIEGGKRRRHSYGLLSKGTMLLRVGRYEEASRVLSESVDVSRAAGSETNLFLSRVKLIAAKCFCGVSDPVELLSIKHTRELEDTQKGEQMYYHWVLTGSRQSLAASAQLISRGLSHGLYFHSYLFMLQKIKKHMPASLADTIPLVHNYPSCE